MEEKLDNLNDTSKEKEEDETPKNIGWPLVAKILIICLIFISFTYCFSNIINNIKTRKRE